MYPTTTNIIFVSHHDPQDLCALQHIFTYHGFQVVPLSSSFNNYENDPPDLVLLNTGYGYAYIKHVCEQIKRMDPSRHIPVIVLDTDHESELLARMAGADVFLPKPYTIGTLLETVEKWL